ncbi:MAG: HEAT repeat domain-containing protein [Acidobacteriota bacterium]|nr:HEAT repeat domain-containing protein [Acidobacteriota bacterium]
MRKTTSLISLFAAILVASSTACATGRGATAAASSSNTTETAAQNQKGVTPASFIRVDGPDLNARLDAAARRARADNAQRPYWTAYSFDVRPGVAVDPSGGEFHGSMNGFGGIYVFSGTNAAGMTVETRNLAVFLLRSPASGAITRMEVYNLDRVREYGGYPVYFTGRASNEESLNFLRGIAEGPPTASANHDGMLNERAALAISLHDDPRVAGILKDFVRTSKNRQVRASSVYWLGAIGGETQFLSDIVRNTSEDRDLRRAAAHAIGESRDRAALSTLQSLYEKLTERELRQAIAHAAANNEDKDAALAFLLRVAKNDPDAEVRKAAVHGIGETGGERAIDELSKIYSTDQNLDLRRTVLHSLSEIDSPRAADKITAVARDANENLELRRTAIHILGEERESDATVAELIRLYDADRNREIRLTVLHALSETKGQRAEDKLFEVARGGDDPALRSMAIHILGERADQRSLALLSDTLNANDAETQVQIQALHAISERPADEAVPLLLKAAKSHPNPQVRRAAIHWLGESGDPRALEFFHQVLTEKPEEMKEQ